MQPSASAAADEPDLTPARRRYRADIALLERMMDHFLSNELEAAEECCQIGVAQAPLLGEGRVMCVDGGGQHSVVLVEAA